MYDLCYIIGCGISDFYQGLSTEMCLCNTELCNAGHPNTITDKLIVFCLAILLYFIIKWNWNCNMKGQIHEIYLGIFLRRLSNVYWCGWFCNSIRTQKTRLKINYNCIFEFVQKWMNNYTILYLEYSLSQG